MKHVIALSAIDQFAVRCYVNVLICFRMRHLNDCQSISNNLKEALAALANRNPFIRARITPATSRGYVEAHYCDDDPDPSITTQTCYDVSFADLERSGFNVHSGIFDDFSQSPEDRGHAVLALKLSFIRDGCVLCVSSHHSFFDGHGAIKIIRTIASYCVGKPKDLELRGLHDRLTLLHGNGTDESHMESAIRLPGDQFRIPSFPQPQSEPRAHKASISVIISITKFAADELKISALSDAKRPNAVSRLDIISGFLFARIMKARDHGVRTNTICSLNTAVDVRSRLAAPLSDDYLGNVVIGACVSIPLDDLATSDATIAMQNIANLAIQLRAEIMKIDDTAVRHSISWLEYKPNITDHFNEAHPADISASMMISSWAGWPIGDLDFGGLLGRPVAVRSCTGDSEDLRIQPRMTREAPYEITTVLERGVLQKLQEDVLLGKWFDLRLLGY